MILALVTADRIDLGDALGVAQLGPDHPVLQGSQILGRIGLAVRTTGVRRGVDRIHEDFAQACGDRAEFGRDAGGKLAERVLQPLVDQLAREIDVGAVVEDDGNLAQPVA